MPLKKKIFPVVLQSDGSVEMLQCTNLNLTTCLISVTHQQQPDDVQLCINHSVTRLYCKVRPCC